MPQTRVRQHGTMDFFPQNAAERIEAFRHIVKEWQYAKIDGVMVDGFTASIVVKIFDGLNETNREKFMNMPAPKACVVALKLANAAK